MEERTKQLARRQAASLGALGVVGVLALLALFVILAYPVGVLVMFVVLWLAVPVSVYFLYHRRHRSQRELSDDDARDARANP